MAQEPKVKKRKSDATSDSAPKKTKTGPEVKLSALAKAGKQTSETTVSNARSLRTDSTRKQHSRRSEKSSMAASAANKPRAASNSEDSQDENWVTANLEKDAESVEAGQFGSVEEDEYIANQTPTPLEELESSSDEDADSDEGGIQIADIPSIPSDSKVKTRSGNADGEGPGVVYVGRVPHGFYEHQMRAYFSQFGDITKLRLSRNKKTGHSKHYAFIEFASAEVARIVAATMNKYLLFGHILQVRVLAPEEVHKDLFKGANKRFKVVPRNKIQARNLRLPMERERWDKRVDSEMQRRKAKEAKLLAIGYEFVPPSLKGTDTVPVRRAIDTKIPATSTTE